MNAPKPIQQIPISVCKNLKGILTDIDDTLTLEGKLLACAYQALAKAKEAGLIVIVVTGRPAGWADHIARMWPIDAVIGENGAFYFHMKDNKLRKRFLQSATQRKKNQERLMKLGEDVLKRVPGTALASDQAYRSCDLAIDFCEDVKPIGKKKLDHVCEILKAKKANFKVSSIHVNAWFGAYDKQKMTEHYLKEVQGISIKKCQEQFVYLGDSPNDEPLFAFFTHAIGVANVLNFLPEMKDPPGWITKKPGSFGFREAIQIILKHRSK